MPRHPPNAQKSTNSTQHTTTNLTSDTGARTALGPAQPTLCRAAHARPPTPTPPDQRTNGEDKRGPQGGGEPKQQQKNILDARVHYADHNPPARNPPNHATPPQNPPPGEPGEQNPKEAGPTRKGGAPNPGRTAPEPDSVPRPHNNDCGEGQGAARPGGDPPRGPARPATPSVFAAQQIRNPLERR